LHVAARLALNRPADDVVLVCLSGRGDKDVDTVREHDPT
jgi:tryptophan synthase beta subunit